MEISLTRSTSSFSLEKRNNEESFISLLEASYSSTLPLLINTCLLSASLLLSKISKSVLSPFKNPEKISIERVAWISKKKDREILAINFCRRK